MTAPIAPPDPSERVTPRRPAVPPMADELERAADAVEARAAALRARRCECGRPLSTTNKSGRCRACYLEVPARERSGTFGAFQLHPSHLVTGTHVPGSRATVDLGTVLSRPEEIKPAVLQVCGHAADAAQAREWLEWLGLPVPLLRGVFPRG